MSKYTKKVYWNSRLWVEAQILKDGRLIQNSAFIPIADNAFFIEGRFKAAHKWADKLIKVLEQQETPL